MHTYLLCTYFTEESFNPLHINNQFIGLCCKPLILPRHCGYKFRLCFCSSAVRRRRLLRGVYRPATTCALVRHPTWRCGLGSGGISGIRGQRDRHSGSMFAVPDPGFLRELASLRFDLSKQAHIQAAVKVERAERLENPSARAAFSLVQWQLAGSTNSRVPCVLCGSVTSAFCGSCHPRCSPENPPPMPICALCDKEEKVCRLCQTAGWSHVDAKQFFDAECSDVEEGKQAMFVYGSCNEDGVFTRFLSAQRVLIDDDKIQGMEKEDDRARGSQ